LGHQEIRSRYAHLPIVKIEADNQTGTAAGPLPDDPRHAPITIRADVRTNASQVGTMAAVALILTMIHKLDIAWRSWLANWPEVVLAVGALACSVAALASSVGSTLSWTFTAACLVLALGAFILTARRE
jgi:hypothetical protein